MISVESNAGYEIQTDETRPGGDRVLRSDVYTAVVDEIEMGYIGNQFVDV